MQIKLFSGWLGQEILGHNVSGIIRPAAGQPGDIISITFAQENVLIMRRRWGHQNGKMENVFFYLEGHMKVRIYLLLHSFINFKYLQSCFIYVSVSVRSTQQNNVFKGQWCCVYIKLYDDWTRGKLHWNVSGSWKDGTHWQHQIQHSIVHHSMFGESSHHRP